MAQVTLKSTHESLKSGVDRLVKAFPAEVKSVDGNERQFKFTITTNDVDREKDIISPDGWKLENYLANPVVLWAHDYRQAPVGVSRSLEHTANGLASVCEFADPKDYHFAGTVAALVRMGALRATSVGFRTLEWTWDETRGGVNFLSQELLEYSIVPVPANPHCLVEARASGIDVEPLREWAAKTLEHLAEVPKAPDAPKTPDSPIHGLPDFAALKQQIDEACGAVNRFTILLGGLKTAADPAPTVTPAKTVESDAVDPADSVSTPAQESVVDPVVLATTPEVKDEDDIDLDSIIEDGPTQLSADDIRDVLKELAETTVAEELAKRRGRVD